MDISTRTSHIAYRLQENVEMSEREDGVAVISPFFQITIAPLSQSLRRILLLLADTTCSARQINTAIREAHEENMLTTFYRYLSSLLRHQMLFIYAGSEDRSTPLATLIPISSYVQHQWINVRAEQAYQMSRFAYIRRAEDGMSYLESPLAHARIRLEHPVTTQVIYHLGKAITPCELIQAIPEEEKDNLISVLALLVMGNFAAPTTPTGRLHEEEDETLQQWDFHDLLFHSRSRTGRHNNPLGGTYRFLRQLPPQPAIKQAPWPATISLPRPDRERMRSEDPGLEAVMEARASLRDYGTEPITLAQLAEFLYRVARVKEVYDDDDSGEFTVRPFPGSGASYEMEFYLTIDRCEGLQPGFYWYDPLQHALALIQESNKDTARLLYEAYQAMGAPAQPQVLITLAARFQRVSWKYQSIAYALILKNVGVIYATMYLVATAMDLAPCALGVGDSDHFTKLSGTNYLQETSVGEFALGSKPTPTSEIEEIR
ncbi:SagB/ThcOx family dehydrogenase [Dictyobacter arantiisoli]|uniref:Uncharacterized protein n=1 Tax=Dictyobacter arantiisoli TaxID=2014874 RepID=A0A5A5TEC8_9CHLR|nr:SagB family peptide dehydrogenase [Dictyobacter arantiisoli]GCF09910.1 hypothetical protein KDI_34740 [Dictyobacter arantiisoli]